MSVVEGIEGANALVVGGSGGIGFGFVKELIQDQNVTKIFATYRERQSANQLISLADQYPNRLFCLSVDLTDESQISQAVTQISTTVNQLHFAINCVGILHEEHLEPEKSLQQIDPDYLRRYFEVNSIGGVLLAKHLLPLFRHGDRSIFATISAKIGSIGDNHLGGWYGYRASKAALNMLLRTVAIEYSRKSPHTIVAMLHPGTTDTRLSEPFQNNVPEEKLFSVSRTVTQLINVIEKLDESDSGEFFSWDGSPLPW